MKKKRSPVSFHETFILFSLLVFVESFMNSQFCYKQTLRDSTALIYPSLSIASTLGVLDAEFQTAQRFVKYNHLVLRAWNQEFGPADLLLRLQYTCIVCV